MSIALDMSFARKGISYVYGNRKPMLLINTIKMRVLMR